MVVWPLVTGLALFYLLKFTMGVRVSEEEEMQGLDISEHGIQLALNAPTTFSSPHCEGRGLWSPPALVFRAAGPSPVMDRGFVDQRNGMVGSTVGAENGLQPIMTHRPAQTLDAGIQCPLSADCTRTTV